MSIRLGIIGTGRIANRFAQDAWQKTDATLCAVFNPHIKSAQDYAARYHLPVGTDDWRTFTEHIDAAWVASPPAFHGGYIRRLLESGKHVLCEKPMVLGGREAEELFSFAREKGLILMEAVKTACCPGFQALLKLACDGRIGEIRDVEACFTRLTDPGLRELTDRACGGSMTEFGTYGCFAVLKILGCDYRDVRFAVQRDGQGMDIFTKVFLTCKDGRTGLVKAGLGVKSEGELILSGTKGYILVQAPWWLTRRVEIRYEDPDRRDVYEYPYAGSGLQYELECFLDKIRGMDVKSGVTPEESIAMAEIMERFLLNEKTYRRV